MSEKELFYVGLTGSSPVELGVLLSVVCGCMAISRALKSSSVAFNSFLFCVPLCLSMTLLADHCWALVVALLIVAALLSGKTTSITSPDVRRVLAFYRSGMMLATCIAILAVDFVVFPRRFAKTEEFGFSLMDLGVGSFLVSSGLVMRNAASWKLAVVESGVVLGLGVVRFAVTTLVGYHQHVSEYGSHWNFFLSIGLLLLLTKVARIASWPTGGPGVAGAVCIGGIQAVYSFFPETVQYMLSSPRQSFLSHNREGIVGLVGFWGLMLLGIEVGRFLKVDVDRLKQRGILLAIASVACFALSLIFHTTVQHSSRRLANAAYCISTLGLNCMLISGLIAVELSFPLVVPHSDLVAERLSKKQFVVFLIANLVTGAVNMTINTISQPPLIGFVIVLCYSCCLAALGTLL